MHAIRRLAVFLSLGLILLLSACGTKYLTVAPGACKDYNPQQPPLIQNNYYNGNERQEHFSIPANSTLISVADLAWAGRAFDLYPAPVGGGTVYVSATEAGNYRDNIVQILVVHNTDVKQALEWLIVEAIHNDVPVAEDYTDTKGNEVSAGVYFGLNPCVDNM